MKVNKFKALYILSAVFLLMAASGCKKLVVVDPPPTSILGSSAYSSDFAATGVLNSIYASIISNGVSTAGGPMSLSFYGGLSADEFTVLNTVSNAAQLAYYRNALAAYPGNGYEYWLKIYPYVYTCNAAIEGLNNSATLTPAVKEQLLGEAYFMRAFFYFYLVNLYGDVPLALSSDYTINDALSRVPKAQVYQQIINDLHNAQGLLSPKYLDITLLNISTERVRPTQWAATALLARAYLYTNNWAGADSAASAVIANTTYYNLTTLNNVFLKNSQEAIWQLQPVNLNYNTVDGQFFIYPTTGGPTTANPVYLSSSLLSSFEPGDQRRYTITWVDSMKVGSPAVAYYFPYKYKIYLSNPAVTSTSALTEYEMVLRLGEQYLIRAEARAQEGNTTGAQADLNAIRTRAGLSNTTASTQSALLTAIMHERQVELFSEWGHRWLDLKRTGNIDAVMGTGGACVAKGGTWNSYQQLYPVWTGDIKLDNNLTQNPGY